MRNYILLFLTLSIFLNCSSQVQEKDTIYITFDSNNEGMSKNVIPKEKLTKNNATPVDDSFVYMIDEKNEGHLYEFAYEFSHFNWSKNKYIRDSSTYKPPQIIKKNKRFLEKINVLKNDFFKNTKYRDVCKTFEEEDSREQDVTIFIIDLEEIKNNTIVLREVYFSRPIKE
jgi:hypothetical protein